MQKVPSLLRVIGVVVVVSTVVLASLPLVGDTSYTYTALFDETLDPSLLNTLSLFAPDTALTFARYEREGQMHVVLVTTYRDGNLEGLDLNDVLQTEQSDPIALFNQYGYDRLAGLLAEEEARVRLLADRLTVPLEPMQGHIALGTNFPEHGEEVAVEQPFLFLKMGEPRPAMQDIAVGDALLDYEGEVGFVLLQDQLPGFALPAYLGFVAANDFTDRALLMRRINFLNIESGQGFTEAKSGENYFPIGALLVIPRDWQTFYPNLEIRLYVNGALRQRDVLASMTWHPDRFLDEIFARADAEFQYGGQMVRLLQNPDRIPAGTIILSSTPAGVVFNSPGARQVLAGITPYILSFDWQRASIFDRFLQGASEAEVFLQADDVVVTRVEGLGIIETTIVP